MNPEAKQKFVNALRSGKYQQTTKRMVYGDKYCALGVFLEISGISKIYHNGKAICFQMSSFNDYTDLGSTPHEADQLVDWNDHDKLTFPQIADLIEEKF